MSFITFQLRRATTANWTADNPVLSVGEIALTLNGANAVTAFRFGDGATAWTGLSDFSTGGGGGGVSDGDKGDIAVSSSGSVWEFDSAVVTAFARTILDDIDAGSVRSTLGLGTAAIAATGDFAAASHTHAIANVTGLQTALDGKEATIGAGTTAQYWRGDKSFQTLDKSAVGLGNVDNTSDANKPVSTAQSTAIGLKLDATHAGTGGASHSNVVAAGTAGFMTGADKSKLDGVATSATSNSSDATLLARANHTGTQVSSTISDFNASSDARIAAASINALNDVTISAPSTGQVLKWNGSAWVNDTDATGGGGGGSVTPGRIAALKLAGV